MAERNLRKERSCKFCGECVLGKASKLKEHARECIKTHQMAAAEAIRQKMVGDMLLDDPALASGHIQMADERVMNAEGD